MGLIILLIILFCLFGGGLGTRGYGYGHGVSGGFGLIFLIVLLFLLF